MSYSLKALAWKWHFKMDHNLRLVQAGTYAFHPPCGGVVNVTTSIGLHVHNEAQKGNAQPDEHTITRRTGTLDARKGRGTSDLTILLGGPGLYDNCPSACKLNLKQKVERATDDCD